MCKYRIQGGEKLSKNDLPITKQNLIVGNVKTIHSNILEMSPDISLVNEEMMLSRNKVLDFDKKTRKTVEQFTDI